tara:strand:+ start:2500 stop:3279 length:780 start_codon:yes stop_codon:yes gene_type:complete
MFKKYSLKQIKESLNKLNIKKNDIVYVSGNLVSFGKPEMKNLNNLPKVFFNEIYRLVGKGGTIMFPSHSFDLVNTNKIFDINKTKCISGSFSNYIMENKKFYRQLHPYASIAGIGKYAKYICNYKDNDVYGLNCPFEKLIKLKSKFISLGMEINKNCTQVHFLEKEFKVKYRFEKYFYHRILLNNKIVKKKFSMFVLKNKYLNIKRNENKLITNYFLKNYKIKKRKLGSSWIYSYDIKKFYDITKKMFKKNRNAWLGKN